MDVYSSSESGVTATNETESESGSERGEENSYYGVDPPMFQDRPQHQTRAPTYLQQYKVPSTPHGMVAVASTK